MPSQLNLFLYNGGKKTATAAVEPAVEPGSKGLLPSFNLILASRSPESFVLDTDSVDFLDTCRDGEAFFKTQFNFMIPEIYKDDMCHTVTEEA